MMVMRYNASHHWFVENVAECIASKYLCSCTWENTVK
jgi:hypothetical protein